ncbi:hypothetical protein KIW84_035219 [Lathyrus oleraceus]|uniref:Uncharacterized protein n=1 Tax=Pisum sativum TaxID=3888 RepID=A0A9D5B0G8_PEA|nr:hypothetical protein KIW84_035219 [Pisum sativum]
MTTLRPGSVQMISDALRAASVASATTINVEFDSCDSMEWSTLQHLDLRHIGRGVRPLQPHAASFHLHQAFFVVAIGTYIVEFDALTGSKISAVDIGAPAV